MIQDILLPQAFRNLCKVPKPEIDNNLNQQLEAASSFAAWIESKIKISLGVAFYKLQFHRSSPPILTLPKPIIQKDGGSSDSRIDKAIIQNLVRFD